MSVTGGTHMHFGAMFNAYPDSLGSNLKETVDFLSSEELKDAFRSFYILPTVFNTDLDGGFSVISYDLCRALATEEDLASLKTQGIDLTFDFILNHLSVLSPQFQDILRNGDNSKYRHFFIDWNQFWEGRGEMTEDGYIKPYPDQFNYGNLRKNGLPILMVRFPDGRAVPYWNTFYQQILYPRVSAIDMMELTDGQYRQAELLADFVNRQLEAGKTPSDMDWTGFEAWKKPAGEYLACHAQYMGQMDVNFENPQVWEWYDGVMKQLADHGAAMIRLDAFSRLHKAPCRTNFVNEPETWEMLDRLRTMAESHGLEVLPEIHAAYSTKYYKKLSDLGCMTYDYCLPGLILDALETGDTEYLYAWADEIIRDRIRVVNMLGCHDGIPMRDVRGLLPESRVDAIIDRLARLGGHKKIVHGVVDEIYQIDMTYYSALGCDDRKLELARAIQLFMPGKPQIWYIDLLAGASDEDILLRDPSADTREVNRRCYTPEEVKACLQKSVVQNQLRLLKLRNTHPAFSEGAAVFAERPSADTLTLTWCAGEAKASLHVDLAELSYEITLQ